MPNFLIPEDVDVGAASARVTDLCAKFPAIGEEVEKVRGCLREENADKGYDNLEEFVAYSTAELLGLSKEREYLAGVFYFPHDFENAGTRLLERPELFAKMQEVAQMDPASWNSEFNPHLLFFTQFSLKQIDAQKSGDPSVKYDYVKFLENLSNLAGDDIDVVVCNQKYSLAMQGHVPSCLEMAEISKLEGNITKAALLYAKALAFEERLPERKAIGSSLAQLPSQFDTSKCQKLTCEELVSIIEIMPSEALCNARLTNVESKFVGNLVVNSAAILDFKDIDRIVNKLTKRGGGDSLSFKIIERFRRGVEEGKIAEDHDMVNEFARSCGLASDETGVILSLSDSGAMSFSVAPEIIADFDSIDEIAKELRKQKAKGFISGWNPKNLKNPREGFVVSLDSSNIARMKEEMDKSPSSVAQVGGVDCAAALSGAGVVVSNVK